MLETVLIATATVGVPALLFWQSSKIRFLRDELKRAQDRSDYWQKISVQDGRELVKLKEAVLKAVHRE